MIKAGEVKGLKDVGALTVEAREVGADGREARDTGVGTEATGDLLLQLGHADIALRLLVVAGHAQIGDETQHVIALLTQALDEVVGRGLRDPPVGARRRLPRWVVRCGGLEDRVVGPLQALDLGGG